MIWHLFEWFGYEVTATLTVDRAAAKGMLLRDGVGGENQFDIRALWLQQESIKDKIKLNKVLGTENPADMNTKGLNIEQIEKFCRMLKMDHRTGRAELAPEMHKLIHKKHCERFNSTSAVVSKRSRKESTINNTTKFEERCIAGIELWKCPCASKCGCDDNVMFCTLSARYGDVKH